MPIPPHSCQDKADGNTGRTHRTLGMLQTLSIAIHAECKTCQQALDTTLLWLLLYNAVMR